MRKNVLLCILGGSMVSTQIFITIYLFIQLEIPPDKQRIGRALQTQNTRRAAMETKLETRADQRVRGVLSSHG